MGKGSGLPLCYLFPSLNVGIVKIRYGQGRAEWPKQRLKAEFTNVLSRRLPTRLLLSDVLGKMLIVVSVLFNMLLHSHCMEAIKREPLNEDLRAGKYKEPHVAHL